MPSLKGIRRRISSVKNTQKITRAMKLVAAAKFARANAAVVAARPYGKAFDDMVTRLVDAGGSDVDSPLLQENEEKRSLVVLVATDRGFCGSLNSNLFKHVLGFISEKKRKGVEVDVGTWGKRAVLFGKKLSETVESTREKVLETPTYEKAKELAEDLEARFIEKPYDRVYLAFVEFRSALSQQPKVTQVLPLGNFHKGGEASTAGILVEPDMNSLLSGLLGKAVASVVFRCLLEGAASEHGARMTAMDSATNNADEVIKKLTIEYNRARQAIITTELIEITAGAEAL